MNLTKRQLEVMNSILFFTKKSGYPPTLKDLTNILGVKSDQAVLDILDRLQRKGFINRLPGQARSLMLTAEGGLALGQKSSGSDSALKRQLTRRQYQVYKRLIDIDPKLGKIYAGALYVIKDSNNPDCVSQSANSIREIVKLLSDKGFEEKPNDKEKNGSDVIKKGNKTVAGLKKFFDPFECTGLDSTVYDEMYDRFQKAFHRLAHHGKEVSIGKFLELLEEFEDFLLKYVLPLQVEVYERIDRLIGGDGSKDVIKEIKYLITRNFETRRYFFRRVKTDWLEPLKKNGLLIAEYEVGKYLLRAADQCPEEVFSIIDGLSFQGSDSWSKVYIVEIVDKLPAHLALRMCQRIVREQWIKVGRESSLVHRLIKVLQSLVEKQDYDSTFVLAKLLLDIPETQPRKDTYFNDVETLIKSYHYARVIESLRIITPEHSGRFIQLLVLSLEKVLVKKVKPEYGDDYSRIWRGTIEDSEHNLRHLDVKNALVSGIRDLLESRLSMLDADQKKRELNHLLDVNSSLSILKRIKLHMYRLYPTDFFSEIETSVIELFPGDDIWHEYALILQERFSQFSSKTKDEYFKMVDKGPNEANDIDYVSRWKVRQLAVIRDHLTLEKRTQYEDLLSNIETYPNPELTFVRSRSRWEGPRSPVTEQEFNELPVSEIVDYLIEWQPDNNVFESSREGLGRIIRAVVKERASEFSANALLFSHEKLYPVYIYNFLSGLNASITNESQINWGEVLSLAATLVRQYLSETMPQLSFNPGNEWESKWDGVFEEIAKTFEVGFDSQSCGIPFSHQPQVWEVLTFLCAHPDPTPEHEEKYGGESQDPLTMSINTVRGVAFHALFKYIFWFNRNNQNTAEPISIPNEAMVILEEHLRSDIDPSLTVRSVYGEYLPWLISFGKDWAKDLIPVLLPLDNNRYFYAAWQSYLSNAVYTDTFICLRPYYEKALKDLKKNNLYFKSHVIDPVERLAEHAAIAYLHEVESGKDTFAEMFFAKAKPKYRGLAISFIGTSYLTKDDTENARLNLKRLKQLWQWRLKESNSHLELKEFGWWARSNVFNNKWMLERLHETVTATKGVIESDFIVFTTLAQLSRKYPLLCAKIIHTIVIAKEEVNNKGYLYDDEIKVALYNIFHSSNRDAKSLVTKTIDYLTKLGFEDFRYTMKLKYDEPES